MQIFKCFLIVILFSCITPSFTQLEEFHVSNEIDTLVLPSGTYKYASQQIIVQPSDELSSSQLLNIIDDYDFMVKDILSYGKYGFVTLLVPESVDILTTRDALKASPFFNSASLNYVGEAFTNDTYYSDQWALRKIDAANAWNKFTKGDSNVVLAILDSGYWIHEDIDTNRVIRGENYTTYAMDDSFDHAMGMTCPTI